MIYPGWIWAHRIQLIRTLLPLFNGFGRPPVFCDAVAVCDMTVGPVARKECPDVIHGYFFRRNRNAEVSPIGFDNCPGRIVRIGPKAGHVPCVCRKGAFLINHAVHLLPGIDVVVAMEEYVHAIIN